MKGLHFAVFAVALAAGAFASDARPAEAKPNVALKMSGYVVQRSGNVEKLAPIEQTEPHPGDVIRYVVVATNAGSDPANKLVVAARVPQGTSFEGGSATSNALLHPQFSLDGGKTWAATPTIAVKNTMSTFSTPIQ